MGWLTEGLLGNDEGDGPQWPWAASTWDVWDRFAGNPPPDNDGCGAAQPISGPGMTGFDNSSGTTGSEGQTNVACA